MVLLRVRPGLRRRCKHKYNDIRKRRKYFKGWLIPLCLGSTKTSVKDEMLTALAYFLMLMSLVKTRFKWKFEQKKLLWCIYFLKLTFFPQRLIPCNIVKLSIRKWLKHSWFVFYRDLHPLVDTQGTRNLVLHSDMPWAVFNFSFLWSKRADVNSDYGAFWLDPQRFP